MTVVGEGGGRGRGRRRGSVRGLAPPGRRRRAAEGGGARDVRRMVGRARRGAAAPATRNSARAPARAMRRLREKLGGRRPTAVSPTRSGATRIVRRRRAPRRGRTPTRRARAPRAPRRRPLSARASRSISAIRSLALGERRGRVRLDPVGHRRRRGANDDLLDRERHRAARRGSAALGIALERAQRDGVERRRDGRVVALGGANHLLEDEAEERRLVVRLEEALAPRAPPRGRRRPRRRRRADRWRDAGAARAPCTGSSRAAARRA